MHTNGRACTLFRKRHTALLACLNEPVVCCSLRLLRILEAFGTGPNLVSRVFFWGGISFLIMAAATFCEILIAILLPPLGVFLRYSCGLEFWICLILTILGYIPGILYALYVLLV